MPRSKQRRAGWQSRHCGRHFDRRLYCVFLEAKEQNEVSYLWQVLCGWLHPGFWMNVDVHCFHVLAGLFA